MPSTSLAEQLKRLSVPQTSQLQDKTWKPSLLFDFKEAASIDKDTFYKIGISGIEELEKINDVFSQYKNTLFDVTSVNFVRSVETSDRNMRLDKEINKFLIHCSPYFLLNPTHKALEWLVYRFQIQDYNSDSVLMLAFPYYETTSFAQVIQILNVRRMPKWDDWLAPIKKSGTPLSKTAVLNRAATDMAFFKFVCNMPLLAIEVYKEDGNCLKTLFAFYCTTVIGAFEKTSSISDLHISHLLPSLTAGFSSTMKDFVASSYMILSYLSTKVQLSKIILQSSFNKISQVKIEEMRPNAILLMVILCQRSSVVTVTSLQILVGSGWFMKHLVDLFSSGIAVFPLVIDTLSCCITVFIEKRMIWHRANELITSILKNIDFIENECQQLFRLLLDAYSNSKTSMDKDLSRWFSSLLKGLEKKYPEQFDSVVSNPKYSKVLKCIVGIVPEYTSQSDLFEKLNHPNEDVRAEAVKAATSQLKPVETSWLKDSILQRLADDSPKVVKTVLVQPATFLKSLIGLEQLADSLLSVVNQVWSKNDRSWWALAPILFAKLDLLIPTDFNEFTLLISVVPFLLGNEKYLLKTSDVILSSHLMKRHVFLKAVQKEIGNISNTVSNETVVKAFWKTLENSSELSLKIEENVIQTCLTQSSIKKFFVILFCGASLPTEVDPLLSSSVIQHVFNLTKESQIVFLEPYQLNVKTVTKIMQHSYKNKLPLQVIQYFLCNVINKTLVNFDLVNYWWNMKEPSQEFLFNILRNSFAVSQMSGVSDQAFRCFLEAITEALKGKTCFERSQDYCKLLCNVIARDTTSAFNCFTEMKILLKNDEHLSWVVELDSSNMILPTLLIGLALPEKHTRELVLEIISHVVSSLSNKNSPVVNFINKLILWTEEISCDADQTGVALYMLLSPDPAVKSSHSKELQKDLSDVRNSLLSIATNDATPTHVVTLLFKLLAHVNSADIMKKLIPVAISILELQNITEPHYSIVESVLKKIDVSVISVFEDDNMWKLAEECLKLHNKHVLADSKTPAVLFLQKISREIYDGLSDSGKHKMIDLAVTVNADSEDGEVNIAVMSMVKKIVLDSSSILPILCAMKDAKIPPLPGRRRWVQSPSWELLKTIEWRKGISLLELVQNKKKLNNVQLLLSPLFDILKRCLEFEEQSPVEYAKQLLLSTFLHICQKMSEEGTLNDVPQHIIQIELIIQCIRASHNPQTHHHALLVLAEVASLVPDKVLHDIMPVFTFVGSSVLRMDDAYSSQIILKIIERVVPILVQDGENRENMITVQKVLQVFVDALTDIPEHRRLSLLVTLITTLDSDANYLWLFICLVAQNEVLTYDASKAKPESAPSRIQKLKVLKNLCLEFPAIVLIKTLYQVMNHVASLPHNKDSKTGHKKEKLDESSVFSVEKNTGKQLRHYKYIILNFISTLISTPKFINMLLAQNYNSSDEHLIKYFKRLVNVVLDYSDAVSKQVNITLSEPSSKYWKTMKHLLEDINGKVNAVLPNVVFFKMIKSILLNECSPKKQRKMLEVLNWRLQSTALEKDEIVALVPPILNIVHDYDTSTTDGQVAQQAAFIVLKLIARQAASDNPAEFEKALACVTNFVRSGLKKKSTNKAVLASAVLCLAELVATLGSKSIQYIPKFMPPVIQTISQARSDPDIPEILLVSVVTTVQKVLEFYTEFINPYLDKLITELCLISAKYFEEDNPQKSNTIINKLTTIRKNLSEKLELRVLLPAIESSFAQLLDFEEHRAIAFLLALLGDSFVVLSNMRALQSFFMKCLDFRSTISDSSISSIVEPAIVSCIVSMVLKMNELEFHPFYTELCNWAHADHSIELAFQKELVFYGLSSSLAETLKSIFVSCAPTFLEKSVKVLCKYNSTEKSSKSKTCDEDESDDALPDAERLLERIFQLYSTVLKYNNDQYIKQFTVIIEPLVDQLENTYCQNSEVCSKLLVTCFGRLALSTSDDSIWKKMNYDILMKTRSADIKTRLLAIEVIKELAKELGDSYLPFLPEAIPFLAELLEDEEEEVEKACRSAVQHLESVLEEDISKYF